MFIVRNKAGNVYREIETERDRDYYLSLGYIEVVEEPQNQKTSANKSAKKIKSKI